MQTFETVKKRLSETKRGALEVGMLNNCEAMNVEGFTQKYLGKSPEWLREKINGFKEVTFTHEEFAEITKALREFAKDIEAVANKIDSAE